MSPSHSHRNRLSEVREYAPTAYIGAARLTCMTRRACSAACLAVVSLLLVVACTRGSTSVATSVALDATDFYPLNAGNAWSYDVDTGEPMTTLATTRVESFDGRVAEVHTANAVVRYEVLPEGIRVLPEDAWLIRAPFVRGKTWPGPGGRDAELVATALATDTPAGRFDDCVEVRETGGRLELEVHTVYCPGVGPVSVTSTMRSNVSERALTVSARLRDYSVTPASPRR